MMRDESVAASRRVFDSTGEIADERKLVYATATIEIAFLEDADEPYTQSEIEDFAHNHGEWTSWRVLNVSQKRSAPATVRGHVPRETR